MDPVAKDTLKSKFLELDDDGDGKLTHDQLNTFLRSCNTDMNDEEIGTLFKDVQKEVGDLVGWEELLRWIFPAEARLDDDMFDTHAHMFDFMQKTEGVASLAAAMEVNRVIGANVCGSPLQKSWVDSEEERPRCHFSDEGQFYYDTFTDAMLTAAVAAAPPEVRKKVNVLCCGLNLCDRNLAEIAEQHAKFVQGFKLNCAGMGVLLVRVADVTNLTMSDGVARCNSKAFGNLTEYCGKSSMPIVFKSNSSSMGTKEYRAGFEYLHEVELMCEQARSATFLWSGGGIFERGSWKGYSEELSRVLSENKNLYIAITPQLLQDLEYTAGFREQLTEVARRLWPRFMVGTSVLGEFWSSGESKCVGMDKLAFGSAEDFNKQKEEFKGLGSDHRKAYNQECEALRKFAAEVSQDQPEMLRAILHENAMLLFGKSSKDEIEGRKAAREAAELVAAEQPRGFRRSVSEFDVGANNLAAMTQLATGSAGGVRKSRATTSAAVHKAEGKTDSGEMPGELPTIDCHLHLLDFLQKSSGTDEAMRAMDGCKVEKAVLFGMSCCKKWCSHEPDQPLYYQDDNGPLYVYSYADQMVADAWLGLDDVGRARFAPMFASFNPTDMNAIAHVRRMFDKYPRMWRGIGEVMCRHDDLTTLLQDTEVPVVDHPAMDAIYEFCVEKNLPVLVHHNCDKIADNDGHFQYVHEVENVLKKHPELRFTWVHCGASRRVTDTGHHTMVDRLLTTYKNFTVDISWVVWEEVITYEDEQGNRLPKPEWVEMIKKHSRKVTIGSDNVAQYFAPGAEGKEVNILAGNIQKYYCLFELLGDEAARRVAYQNAEEMYFKDWDVPKVTEKGYDQILRCYPCERLDPVRGTFTCFPCDDSRF